MTDKHKEIGYVLNAAHKINDHNNIVGGVDTNVDLINLANTKAGSYKYTRPDTGEIVIVPPGDPMWSTASTMSTEYFDGESWINLEELD